MRIPFTLYHLKCSVCKEDFTAKRSDAETCSGACRTCKCRSIAKEKKEMECHEVQKLPPTPPSNLAGTQISSPPDSKVGMSHFTYRVSALNGALIARDSDYIAVHLDELQDPYTKLRWYIGELRGKNKGFFPLNEDAPNIKAMEILIEKRRDLIPKMTFPQEGQNNYRVTVDVESKSIISVDFLDYANGMWTLKTR